MSTYLESQRAHIPAVPWIGAVLVAGLLGYGLGANTQSPAIEDNPTHMAQELPDWHGNVKRSQGGGPSERLGG